MRLALVAVGLVLGVGSAVAQELTADERAKIEAAVPPVLTATGAPSVSVGVARGGKVVYTKAFGNAVLEQRAKPAGPGQMQSMAIRAAVPADAAMAYPVGSISKQFTAVAILLLQEQGKLKLDDPVAKWFPEFTSAKTVTVRNLLSHTSGYSDYAPQDYTIPAWTRPVESYALVKEWATKPLDFEPGTKWQYSNTNFQMAALIIAKITGKTYHDFLWANVITPLKLQGVLDLDFDRDKLKVRGYERHAMGPLRPAILEASGWYTGDGGLAMPVATLLAWDESIVHRTLLKPASYDAMETEFKLKDGTGSGYGLGVFTAMTPQGKHIISHSGEVGGFVSNNIVDLTDDVAYAALTNIEGPGAGAVTRALRPILLPATMPAQKPAAAAPEQTSLPKTPVFNEAHAAQVKTLLGLLQQGTIDRTVLTGDTNFYFTDETLGDFQSSLEPLGALQSVTQVDESLRGGMAFRVYRATFAKGSVSVDTYTQADGKLEQFLVNPL